MSEMKEMYYRRDGTAYNNIMEWAKDYEKQDRRIAEDTLSDGKWISTVFLGLNHNYSSGPPLMFETMVFPSKGNFEELDTRRYSTEKEALAGHKEMVEEWNAKIKEEKERKLRKQSRGEK